ncbi:MAG: carboxypeptidase-like regulatory domain-containing protein, partial [Bacteroidota bacterium]
MRRFLLLSLVLFIYSEYAVGQTSTIFGKVTDQKDTPLFGINIAIENKTIGTISDADGNYRLEVSLAPPYTVRFSSVGFESKFFEVTKYGDYEMNMTLPEATLFGNEVVVSASRYEESILSTAASIEKVDIIGIQQAGKIGEAGQTR